MAGYHLNWHQSWDLPPNYWHLGVAVCILLECCLVIYFFQFKISEVWCNIWVISGSMKAVRDMSPHPLPPIPVCPISVIFIGRSKGPPGMCAPSQVQILSFSCSFWQKYCKIISNWELAHPPWENPGSATDFHTVLATFWQIIGWCTFPRKSSSFLVPVIWIQVENYN